jgi:hypothetical protein
MAGDIAPAEALRIARRLERRAAATGDADDAKAAVMLRLLAAVMATDDADADDLAIYAVH